MRSGISSRTRGAAPVGQVHPADGREVVAVGAVKYRQGERCLVNGDGSVTPPCKKKLASSAPLQLHV